jgi:uncharacterized membrane protein
MSISFLSFLLLIRFTYTGTLFFGFYVWNTFLAFLPVYLSSILVGKKLSNKTNIFLFIVWLLFFPNAAYLVTDVLHFKERKDVPLWFDLILVVQASWVGILCTTVSLKQIEKFVSKYYSKQFTDFMIIGIIVITSYGVYLGRYLRFNSWDIITNPSLIFYESLDRVLNPFSHIKTYCFVFFFSLFIGLKFSYFSFNAKHE